MSGGSEPWLGAKVRAGRGLQKGIWRVWFGPRAQTRLSFLHMGWSLVQILFQLQTEAANSSRQYLYTEGALEGEPKCLGSSLLLDPVTESWVTE